MTDNWKHTLLDKEHPIWKLAFVPVVMISLVTFQYLTATSWDLDGEGIALLGTGATVAVLRRLGL